MADERKEKFTPGPWDRKKGNRANYEWAHLFTAKRGRCYLFGIGEILSRDDANLIAAAPCLYDALKSIIEDDDGCSTMAPELLEKARTVLAKARGES